MFGFQTLACLHNIPVIRSSTDKIQDVYNKAKQTSALIGVPCGLAETVADKSLKIALTVADPLVKPLRGPVNAIDQYAVGKIRQIEEKYPLLKTPTEEVLNTFNEKTEPVRQAVNSVKDTTASTIQQGKETVSHVAAVTVSKATDVADTVYTFCETHVPGKTAPVPRRDFARRTTLLWERIRLTFASLREHGWQSFQSLLMWFRMYFVMIFLRIKQLNDDLMTRMPQNGFLSVLFQRFFILMGITLEHIIVRLRPNDRTTAEMNKPKQQTTRLGPNKRPQTPQFLGRPTLKPDAFVISQSVSVTSEEVKMTSTHTNDRTNLYPRILGTTSDGSDVSDDIKALYEKIKPSDLELLYARLPADIAECLDRGETLTQDQRALHAKIIGEELQRQGYLEN